MKIILLENVAQVGQKYEVKDVPRGHATNFLIPKRLAEPATEKSLKRIEQMQVERASSEEARTEAITEALERLEKEPVTLDAPANENGHLYEGVGIQHIASRLQEMGMQISPEDITLADAPLKAVGEYTVTLSHGDRSGTFSLVIESNA